MKTTLPPASPRELAAVLQVARRRPGLLFRHLLWTCLVWKRGAR